MGVSRKVFENTKMLFLESPNITDSEQLEVEKILKEYSVPYEVQEITQQINQDEFLEKQFTHIISNSIMFSFYEFTQDKLIPVVNTQFILKAVELGRQPAIRPYSPDPKNVLKDVHICIGGLADSDKEAIFGGVRALGGTYSETLNKFVTHLISMDPLEDCCICVQSLKDIEIKIVLPEWIDDCLKFRKRIDEDPYLLNPDVSVKSQLHKLNELDVQRSYNPHPEPKAKFLVGKKFFFGSDLEFSERFKNTMTTLIENSGGKVVVDLQNANCYIGKYRDGSEYVNASKSGINVGNSNWIYWMFEHQKLISPYIKLLHYPFVRGGLKGMEDVVISSTNYSGDARFYIMKLAEAVGAKFTPSLSQKNTHLITATPSGKKFQYALKWGLTVVNHLWLEETYAKWKLQPENHPRYSHLPRAVKLEDIIGETPLDVEVLKSFYDSNYTEVTTNLVEDSEDEASDINFVEKSIIPGQIELEKEEPLYETSNEPQIDQRIPPAHEVYNLSVPKPVDQSRAQDFETPEPPEIHAEPETEPLKTIASKKFTPITPKVKALSNVSNNAIRSSSGRKAKSKAAAKLHQDMEDLNNFQKSHKSREVPLLPEEIEAKKRLREEEMAAKKRRKEDEIAINEAKSFTQSESPSKRPKKASSKSPTPYSINAIATGWEIELSRSDLQILHNLGITIHKEFKGDINTIISPKFMRTEKFLTGLSYKLDYIISPEFLTEVLLTFKESPNDLSQLPDVKTYSLDRKNKSSVMSFTDLSLKTLLEKCKAKIDSNNRLFSGLTFNITAKVPGGAPTIAKILKAHGADNVHVLKTLKDLRDIKSLKPCTNQSVGYLLISNEKGITEKATKILSDNTTSGKIIEWDWVISSIFSMDINHDRNVIYKQ